MYRILVVLLLTGCASCPKLYRAERTCARVSDYDSRYICGYIYSSCQHDHELWNCELDDHQ